MTQAHHLVRTAGRGDAYIVPAARTLDDGLPRAGRARRGFSIDLPEPKFRIPARRTEMVRRAELLDRLERDRARPLVLVAAPAGYGKTTLLTQWTEESGRRFAWLLLDEDDGDPEVLSDSIAVALTTIGVRPGARRNFVLVLDDAHAVPAEVLGDAVLGVLEWLPEGSQLVVASRSEPALPLGRMRAQRMLVEIHAGELSMSTAEGATLLRRAGIATDFARAQSLVGRTEGWPAVLELAAVDSAPGLDGAGHVEALSGDAHAMSEYFRAELTAQLSPAALRFLLRASVLDRLCGALCDEVLERKRSGTVLAELARANVPLQALDASHEWYRLHGLFREMLETELRRADPELRLALHRRAADWHRGAGDLDRAIEHACRGEDLDLAGQLLWANLPSYLAEGRNDLVERWLTAIPAERLAEHGPLALAASHSRLASGSVAVAEQWARLATVSLSGAATKCERAGVMITAAWVARAGAKRMADDATRAYGLLRDDDPRRASCCFLRGTAALLTGDGAEAERLLEEGAARGAVVAADAASLCLAQLAVLAMERDDAASASDFAGDARGLVAAHGLSEYPASALVGAACASVAMLEGRVDHAKAEVAQCLGLLCALDDSLAWLGAEIRILLARVSLALGDVAGARELLADASRQARRTRDVVVFQRWFDDAWNQFDARAETALAGVATLTTAELRVLRFLPTHYSFHEIAGRLQVSSNTVKTHVHAVYRKLDASSRSEAVAHATGAGLLG